MRVSTISVLDMFVKTSSVLCKRVFGNKARCLSQSFELSARQPLIRGNNSDYKDRPGIITLSCFRAVITSAVHFSLQYSSDRFSLKILYLSFCVFQNGKSWIFQHCTITEKHCDLVAKYLQKRLVQANVSPNRQVSSKNLVSYILVLYS